MSETPDKVIQHIQQIRKSKQRSIHDCALILDIPKEDYLRFEEGMAPLTLPEIELLASFFDVPLSTIFNDSIPEVTPLSALPLETRTTYKDLRQKMIQVKLILLRDEAGISLEKLQEMTGISSEDLEAYDSGNKPIRFDHLLQICGCLGQPVDAFFSEEPDFMQSPDSLHSQQKWQNEYPDRSNPIEDPYQQLVDALKQTPKEDQARIAKELLNNLRSL
jgi:transcriptional regulator with XRE-family HTH domain